MNLLILRLFVFVALSPMSVLAVAAKPVGLGRVADNILEPVSVATDLIHVAAIIAGASLVFASIIKYFEHKRSPLMVPLSTVAILFLLGLACLLLPLISIYYKG